MAKKRDLKEGIKNICGNLAAECVMAMEFVPGIDKATMNGIINKIAGLQEHTMSHISFSFDKARRDYANKRDYNQARHAYFAKGYKAIINDFDNAVQEIVKEMNAALPAEQKEANKKAVNA